MTHAVVLFSGGQDSTTALGWAIHQYPKVEALGFAYGQRHEVEIAQAIRITTTLGIQFTTFPLDILNAIGNSALIGNEGDINKQHHQVSEVPASFVPNRNALFLTVAHAYAQKRGANVLVGGMCQTDYSGYPDCRETFIHKMQETLNLGSNADIQIVTPLMHLTKAQTFRMAEHLNVLDMVIDHSHTCYEGDHTTVHPWGHGCGECPACKLRAKGWEEFKATEWNDD